MSKITKEELELLQGISNKMNGIKIELGNNELIKSELVAAFANANKELGELRTGLNSKYGDININLQTGDYEVIEKEAQTLEKV
jgi:hypothetical protein